MARAGIGADVEGFHAVVAAADAGRVELLYVERNRLGADRYTRLVEAVESSGGAVDVVDDVTRYAVTATPQGVVARCRPVAAASLRSVVSGRSPPALIVLDHLEDPRNVGAIARSAAAAGMSAMVVSVDRAAPLGASAFKAAAGAFESLPLVLVRSVGDAMRRLDDAGVWTVGLDASGERSVFGLDLLAEPCAIVVGSEGAGLSRLVRDRVSVVARIPTSGAVESINVSVAAALAMFELARARQWVS